MKKPLPLIALALAQMACFTDWTTSHYKEFLGLGLILLLISYAIKWMMDINEPKG